MEISRERSRQIEDAVKASVKQGLVFNIHNTSVIKRGDKSVLKYALCNILVDFLLKRFPQLVETRNLICIHFVFLFSVVFLLNFSTMKYVVEDVNVKASLTYRNK